LIVHGATNSYSVHHGKIKVDEVLQRGESKKNPMEPFMAEH